MTYQPTPVGAWRRPLAKPTELELWPGQGRSRRSRAREGASLDAAAAPVHQDSCSSQPSQPKSDISDFGDSLERPNSGIPEFGCKRGEGARPALGERLGR